MRHVIAVAVALLAIAVPVSASATESLLEFQSAVEALLLADPTIAPPPSGTGKDKAVGGWKGPLRNNFGLSAHSGPLGQDPKGHLSETIPGTFQGRFRVTCLLVVGNEAAIGLTPTDAASNDQPTERVLVVQDSGQPGGSGDMYGVFEDFAAEDCTMLLPLFDGDAGPITNGNIHVHDAMP